VPSPSVIPFRPPARRRLHEDVAEQLRDAILDGRFAAGRKLPPERELAAEFGVNRTSVREAIKVLEGLGLVSVRQGDGATVRSLVDASLDVLAPMIFHGGRVDGALLAEFGEVMMPLLLEMARLAIERRRPADLATLRRLRDVVADPERDSESRHAASRDLLVHVADMTRNRVWQMLARRVRAFLASAPLAEARRRLKRDPGRIVPIIDVCLAAIDAGRIAEAIDALQRLVRLVGDPEAATAGRAATTKKGSR
jgi:GntR family transcriptional regulator, transcriptional repressor for pyruvate dehydrogenase complex